MFISDDLYYQAKLWLGQEEGSFESKSKKDMATIKQKQWTLQQGKIQDKNGRVEFRAKKKVKYSVIENQEHYNAKVKTARGKPPLFRVDEIVAIKIDKVEKTSSLHSNVLIGKILHVENNYTKVVTSHGIISIFIPPTA